MFFRNLKLFRLEGTLPTTETLSAKLAARPLLNCGALDTASFGWVAPRPNAGGLAVSSNGHYLIALGSEKKTLPGAVVQKQVMALAEAIEKEEGQKPGRARMREIKEKVVCELLPKVIAKPGGTLAWIDPAGGWLGLNSASGSRSDEFLEHFIKSVDDIKLQPLKTKTPVHVAMTAWLDAAAAPEGFTIDEECELLEATEKRSTVRYLRHNLDTQAIRQQIASGKRVTRLGLTWKDRISFVLCEDMSIKRLSFLDVIKEQSHQDAGEAGDLFDADLAIMGGELRSMIADLVGALGGHAEG